MTKKILFLFLLNVNTLLVFSQFPINRILGSNESPTYEQTVMFYDSLAATNKDIHFFEMGQSDFGLPIYLCLLNSKSTDSASVFASARNSTTILINNAIHPGEPCGVNASMQFALDFTLLSESEKSNYPNVAIIPAYNVGGMKNRGQFSRANQNGPEHYGFRGNAKNLDLNRDFIKMDSKNMFTFARIFHALDPDIFIDTHTSNGADYQYTMTYITPVQEKLAPSLNLLFENFLNPFMKDRMLSQWGYELSPYINMKSSTLDKGIVKYNATGRYSMGYADLFNSISITTEAHMLKPFEERVKSTYGFLKEIAVFASKFSEEIEQSRKEAFLYDKELKAFPVNYEVDSFPSELSFKGYSWQYEPSNVTVGKRLKYNRTEPVEIQIPYFVRSFAKDTLDVPSFFIVERQATEVIERLLSNNIEMEVLERDTTINLNVHQVKSYQSTKMPYEGHYLHYATSLETIGKEVQFKKGDVLISTEQRNKRFIVKVLSPSYVDSYFNWNFFDSYLQQKEHFSGYVFEDIANEILENDIDLKVLFEKKMDDDEDFAKSRYQQLNFIYRHSPYYENHAILPVYSIVE
jgi:hypothetical protein